MITIFTPVYNRAYCINRLYDSLVAQTYKDFEWIIIDDGSTDNIADVVNRYIEEDRIKILFFSQKNGGKHTAINNGISKASGDLFYIVDSDDVLPEDAVEFIVAEGGQIIDDDRFAGLALSFIVLSFSFYPSKWRMIVCLLVASSIHNSATIPSLMVIISYLFPNTKLYYKLWMLSIPVSFVAGSSFMSFFADVGADDRVSYLQTDIATSYNVGFRVDFILYSLVPMAIGGYYYIFKRGFNDRLYRLIYDAYLLTNIFWILVIRANYSDRFAYLSWFMIPFILVYPLLKADIVGNQRTWLGLILLGATAFSFLL